MKNLCVQVSNVFKWQKIACIQILKITKQLASLNIQKQIFHKDNQVMIDALHSKYGHLFSKDWKEHIHFFVVCCI